MAISIPADRAQEGDVLLDPADGSVYQLSGGLWRHMQVVPFMGEPWRPEGELILVVRNGHPAEEWW